MNKRYLFSMAVVLVALLLTSHVVAGVTGVSTLEILLWLIGPPILLVVILIGGDLWEKWVKEGEPKP
jgi:hypothetical protein